MTYKIVISSCKGFDLHDVRTKLGVEQEFNIPISNLVRGINSSIGDMLGYFAEKYPDIEAEIVVDILDESHEVVATCSIASNLKPWVSKRRGGWNLVIGDKK